MSEIHTHFGWLVSPYSAKTRSYLAYKEIPFSDIEPNVIQLFRTIKGAVGRVIMPTVRLSDGRWLQDSSLIIDHFEAEAGEPSVHPTGHAQRLASYLLEVFADEWLPMAALHYRWNIEENARFAIKDFARSGIPFLPSWLGQKIVARFADRMRGYLPVLGVDEGTIPGVEEMVATTIRALDRQLERTPYILGGRPCLGDFALFGPLWAHLYRDPGSRSLFDDAVHVRRWMDALREGAKAEDPFLPDDVVPDCLDALFACALEDQWRWIETLVAAIDSYCDAHPDAKRVPRALGAADFMLRSRPGKNRKLVTFVQWKAQRARQAYEAADGAADPWMRRVLGLDPGADVSQRLTHIRNPLVLKNFKPVLARRTP
jgi:glutathione S-transferase